MREHVRHDPDGACPFTCAVEGCGASFLAEAGWKAHVRHVHGGQQQDSSSTNASPDDSSGDVTQQDQKGSTGTERSSREGGRARAVRQVHGGQQQDSSMSTNASPDDSLTGDVAQQEQKISTGTERSSREGARARAVPCTCGARSAVSCRHPDCSQTFANFANRRRHELNVHKADFSSSQGSTEATVPSIDKFSCQCHSSKPVSCRQPGCPQTFVNAANRRRHELNVHKADFSRVIFSCTVEGCGKSFSSNDNLNAHVRSFHEGVRPSFTCSAEGCGKTFSDVRNMKRHVRSVHEGVRLFKCTVEGCGKDFTQSSYVKTHIRTVHEGARPFQCTVEGCGKSFTESGSLNRHVRSVHEGLRPFKCTVEGCEKSFTAKQVLDRHVRNVHKVKPGTAIAVKREEDRFIDAGLLVAPSTSLSLEKNKPAFRERVSSMTSAATSSGAAVEEDVSRSLRSIDASPPTLKRVKLEEVSGADAPLLSLKRTKLEESGIFDAGEAPPSPLKRAKLEDGVTDGIAALIGAAREESMSEGK